MEARAIRTAVVTVALLLASFALAPNAAGHEGITVGPYVIEVGWQVEPPSVGQQNGIQVSISAQADGQPVVDLGPGDLGVVVSTAGQEGSRLPLVPAFGEGTAGRPRGTYEAAYVPNAAATYTFHITGAIHGVPVDLTVDGVVADDAGAPVPGPDPLLLVGGAILVLLLIGMAYLLLKVKSSPAGEPERPPTRIPSKRKPPNRPPPGRSSR